MSSPDHVNMPGKFLNGLLASFIAADGTAAKLLVDDSSALAAAATASSPRLYGGYSLIDLTASSTDSSAKDFQFYDGTIYTAVGGSTGTVTFATNKITRASGSWVTDGWMAGDLVMCFSPAAKGSAIARTAGIDGVLAIVTSVTSTDINVNGTPFNAGAAQTGLRICKVSPLFRATIAANAGQSNVVASQKLLGYGYDGSAMKQERKIGSNDIFAVAPVAAVSALPAVISFAPKLALY